MKNSAESHSFCFVDNYHLESFIIIYNELIEIKVKNYQNYSSFLNEPVLPLGAFLTGQSLRVCLTEPHPKHDPPFL